MPYIMMKHGVSIGLTCKIAVSEQTARGSEINDDDFLKRNIGVAFGMIIYDIISRAYMKLKMRYPLS